MDEFAKAFVAMFGAIGTLYGAIAGGRAVYRNAKSTEQKSSVETMQLVLSEMRTDVDRAKADIEALRAELQKERDHSQRQDREISSLRGTVTAWVQWYSFLVSSWENLRQRSEAPKAPLEVTDDLPHFNS